jgi:hypothetical protein
MLTPDFARAFARQWIAAWNARDLDEVLRRYTDGFEMRSPFIASVAGEALGLRELPIRHPRRACATREPGSGF